MSDWIVYNSLSEGNINNNNKQHDSQHSLGQNMRVVSDTPSSGTARTSASLSSAPHMVFCDPPLTNEQPSRTAAAAYSMDGDTSLSLFAIAAKS